jgi:hypothetical protein
VREFGGVDVTARVALAMSCALLVACRLDRSGIATDNALEDSAILADTSEDTAIAIDTAIDSSVDTAMDARDSAVDTAEAAVDAGPPIVVATSEYIALVEPTIDLTAEGKIDWAHWGLMTETTFHHRAGASSFLSWKTSPAPATRFNNYPVTLTWSNGTPTVSVSTRSGIYQTAMGSTFTLEVAADSVEQQLHVYFTTDLATVWFVSTLSDGSLPEVRLALPPVGTPGGIGHRLLRLTTRFRASGPTTLVVAFEKTNTPGSMSLLGATLE